MILSQRQYVTVYRRLNKLYILRQHNFSPEKVQKKFGITSLEVSISELEKELRRFDHWCNGTTPIDLSSIDNISELLIMARMYLGMTQEELARGLGTSRQNIGRLERTLYQSASLKFIMQVKAFLQPKVEKRQATMAPHEERRREYYANMLKAADQRSV